MRTRTGASLILSLSLSVLLCPWLVGAARADDLAALDQQIAEHPEDGRAYENYAVAAMTARRWDDAISRLRTGVARVPVFGRGYYLLAVAHRNKGEWADAATNYRTCINLKAQENDARFGLAKALSALGDRTGAIEALRRYIDDERDPAKARFVDAARVDLAALERQVQAQAASPPSAAAERAEADKLKAAGKLDAAEAGYRRAIEAAPSDALLRNELGTVLFALKRYVDAAEAFAAATERDGTYAVAWFNLGSALRKADRPTEAVRASMRYVELLPADPDGWYALGQAREMNADDRGAIEAYQRFLAIEARPEQQRYVEKARAQLAALQSRQRAGAMGLKPIERDDVLPMSDGGAPHMADLRDPFDPNGGVAGGVVDTAAPVPAGALVDPFAKAARGVDSPASSTLARDYLTALSAYRRALAAHSERVSARYEKGASLAVAGKLREAKAAWDSVPLEDAQLTAARKQLETLRARK